MKLQCLDLVGLDRDLAPHGLRSGDLGTIVETYEPDGLEIEFVTAAGRTVSVVTLRESDVRPVGSRDVLAVRPISISA